MARQRLFLKTLIILSSNVLFVGCQDSQPPERNNSIDELERDLQQVKAAMRRIEDKIARFRSEQKNTHSNKPTTTQSAFTSFKSVPTDAPLPIYTCAPLEQFNQMVRDIEFHILDLKKQKQTDKSASLQSQLKALKADERGIYSVNVKDPQIHVVGLYEASSAHDAIAPAFVKVSYTGGPIILVLTAYEAVEWNVEIAEGVDIERVILFGHKNPEIKITGDVPVNNLSRASAGRSIGYCFKRSSKEFRELSVALHKLTGRNVATFQGDYRFRGKPIIVGPESNDWKLQHIIARMLPLHVDASKPRLSKARKEAESIRFQAVFVDDTDRRGRNGKAFLSDFTPNGPLIDTMKPLPAGCSRVVVDPESGESFAISGHGVVQLNSGKGRPRALTMSSDLPELSWPCGLTLDTKRNRLLLCSFGGEGYLYAYDLREKSWSVVCSMQNIDAAAIAYSEKHDAVFAVAGVHDQNGEFSPTLLKLSNNGTTFTNLPVGADLPALGHRPQCQLIAVDKKLVLLGPQEHTSGHFSPTTHSYVIDLEDASVTYTAKLQPH